LVRGEMERARTEDGRVRGEREQKGGGMGDASELERAKKGEGGRNGGRDDEKERQRRRRWKGWGSDRER
jgi:hypothetical protein